jgi:hypothetical protein
MKKDSLLPEQLLTFEDSLLRGTNCTDVEKTSSWMTAMTAL